MDKLPPSSPGSLPDPTGSSSDDKSIEDALAAFEWVNPSPIPGDTPSMLKRAAQLMKDGDKDGAKKLVAGVLQVSKNQPDAWYLYACLTDDRNKRVQALQQALALSPSHTRAQQMLSELNKVDDLFDGILPSAPSAPAYPVPAQPYPQPSPQPMPAQPYPQAGPHPVPVQQTHVHANPQPMPGMPAQAAQPPVVYVNVNQAQNNQQRVNVGGSATNVNQMALVLGFLAAGFFGIFGVGHLFNGKIGGALLNFIGGIIWLVVAAAVAVASAGICLLGLVPLHYYLAWATSKNGATTIG
jgi:hypothetical protein